MKVVNGHIISGTSICVDYWLWTPKEKYHHFLTHLHADHTVNLKSTFCEKIYTSPFNAWLLRRWFNISPELIVPLSVGDSHLVYDANTRSRFSVTLLDANHCPGSVMFLFQGDFGNILYTGDFRYDLKILQHPMLKSLTENEAVDRLYLDNTFAAEHCEFPPRQQALRDVINLIKDHPGHNILLGVRKLGKEEVLRAVALELKEKIFVSDEKLRILTKLGYQSVFTTDSEEARIFVKEMPLITPRFIDQLRAERGPVVTILLTALYSVIPPRAKYSLQSADTDKGIYKIPYSDHSCHSELVEFVSTIKPKEMFPIVSSSVRNKVNSSQRSDLSEILSCTWQNSVIPKSILKFSGSPENLGLVVSLVSQNDFMSGVKENAISYMTEDSYETSCENVIGTPKQVQASKAQIPETVEDQISDSEGGTRTGNENLEIISQRNRSPAVYISKQKSQEACFSQKLINPGCKAGFAIPEASQEYFTMSDEDLSQLNVASDQQNIALKQNLTRKEVLADSDVIVKNVQTVCEGNKDSQSNNLCSDLIRSLQPLKDQAEGEKHVSFTPCTPPSTHKCKLVKKRLPTPMYRKAKQTSIEEDEENESYGSEYSDAKSEENEFFTACDFSAGNDVGVNDNSLHPTRNLGCDFENHENLVDHGDFQDLNPPTPVLTNKTTFCTEHPSTLEPNEKHTNVEDGYEENQITGRPIEKLDDQREKHSEVRNVTPDTVNCMRTHIYGQHMANNSFYDTITKQSRRKNQVAQCEVGRQDLFISSSPIEQNKSKMLKKHLPTHMLIKNRLTEDHVDKENNSLTLSNTKAFRDKHFLNKKNNNNYHLKTVNSLPDTQNSLINNISDKKQVISNRGVLASKSKLSKGNISKSMSTTANQSDDCHTNDCLQNNSSDTKVSITVTSTTKGGNQFVEDEKRKSDIGASILKRIFTPQLPTAKQNVRKIGQTNSCLQYTSVTKVHVGATSVPKVGNQFDDDEKRKNDIIASILKRIFTPQLPTAKQNVRKIGQTNSCLQNTSTSVPKVLIGATSVQKVGHQFDDDEKRKYDIRASILKRIFIPQLPTPKQNVGKIGQTNSCLQNTSNSVKHLSIAVISVPKVGNEFEGFKKIKNGIAASTLRQIVHPQLSRVVTRRVVVDGVQTDICVQDSSSSSDISVKLIKPNRKKHEDHHSEHGGSDSTVSDLEDNWMTLEKFETLDRRNDQISESRNTNTSTFKGTRISDKFKHLMVKKFPNKFSGSGFFSPPPKPEQKITCMVVSSLAQNNEVSLESNSGQPCLGRRKNEDKSPVIERINSLQENSQRITELKGIIRKNDLESHNHDTPTKKPRHEFCENVVNVCKYWKEAVRRTSEQQTTDFQHVDKTDTQPLK